MKLILVLLSFMAIHRGQAQVVIQSDVERINDHICNEQIEQLAASHENFMRTVTRSAQDAFNISLEVVSEAAESFAQAPGIYDLALDYKNLQKSYQGKDRRKKLEKIYQKIRHSILVSTDTYGNSEASTLLRRDMILLTCTTIKEKSHRVRSCISFNLITGAVGGADWKSALVRNRHGVAYVEGFDPVNGKKLGNYPIQSTDEYLELILRDQMPYCLGAYYRSIGHNYNAEEIEQLERNFYQRKNPEGKIRRTKNTGADR